MSAIRTAMERWKQWLSPDERNYVKVILEEDLRKCHEKGGGPDDPLQRMRRALCAAMDVLDEAAQ